MLRTLADSRDIVAKAREGARAVVIGSSFIGLEVAASLRARKVEVDVVSTDKVPLARVVGRCDRRFRPRSFTKSTASDSISAPLRKPSALAASSSRMEPRCRQTSWFSAWALHRVFQLAEAAGLPASSAGLSSMISSVRRRRGLCGGRCRVVSRFSHRSAPAHRALASRRTSRARRRALHAWQRRAVSATCRSSGARTMT